MAAKRGVQIPTGINEVIVKLGAREVRLTNLRKPFWKKLGITKGDLLQYYADVSPWLLPHVHDRAMVMKRYPNGAEGDFFYMKRAPEPRPEWIEICEIDHGSAGRINFPIVQDLPSLLWLINLGCIDLNPWYARCDDTDRPDFLHFDLDPGPGANFAARKGSTSTSPSSAVPRKRMCGPSRKRSPSSWKRATRTSSPPNT